MPCSSLQIHPFALDAVGATNLRCTAKKYTDAMTAGRSGDGLTLLFAHCIGSHKEQWEPTIERIFDLQRAKGIRERVREAWSFDWQTHGDAAVLNETALKSREDSVSVVEWAMAIETFVRSKLQGHRIVAFGHSAGTGAIMLSVKNFPIQKPPYIAIFLIEPTMLSQELFNQHAEERVKSANAMMNLTLKRRDTWPDRATAAAYLRQRNPWKSWDPRVLDIYINHGLHLVSDADADAVVLKTSKRQEGLAYPSFSPFIEATKLFGERCTFIPFHIIYGVVVDFMPLYIQQSLCDVTQGRIPASVTRVAGAGHLIVQENPGGLAVAICDQLNGQDLKVYPRM